MTFTIKQSYFGTRYSVSNGESYFEIYNYSPIPKSNPMSIPSMSISVDESCQGQGLTRIMMREMMDNLKWSGDTLLYIDADASSGFWRHIGMKPNENGNGYELFITVDDLNKYINHH